MLRVDLLIREDSSLTFLEFFSLVVAIHLWPLCLQNQIVKFWCVNLAIVHVINMLMLHSYLFMRMVRVCTYITVFCLWLSACRVLTMIW